jgi:hypothetical protein
VALLPAMPSTADPINEGLTLLFDGIRWVVDLYEPYLARHSQGIRQGGCRLLSGNRNQAYVPRFTEA